MKGVGSGAGCFPPLLLRQQSKKMQGGQGEQGQATPAQRRAKERGHTSCGEPGVEGGCDYR